MSPDGCAEGGRVETVGPEADRPAAATGAEGDLLEESVKELVLPACFLEVAQLWPGSRKLLIRKPALQVGQCPLSEWSGNGHVLKGGPRFFRQVSHCSFS